jgi:NADH dehydrogenase (ubiquinone) 1 alpha subcomplex subunit 9
VDLHVEFLFLFMQAMASPREMLLNKVPFPLPTPSVFNLDQIEAYSVDNLVSEDGKALSSTKQRASHYA